MAKRTTSIDDNTPDYLIKDKAQFEKDLQLRIANGERLISHQPTTWEELEQLRQDYYAWDEYNAELISRAFNKGTASRDYQNYTYIGISFIGGGGPPFPESVEEVRQDVDKKVQRLRRLKEKLPLIDEQPGLLITRVVGRDYQKEGLDFLDKLFSRFHRTAQILRHRHGDRETIALHDEYDVQDLMNALLALHFDDVRKEDASPSYAGGNSRVDFLLQKEQIVVEVKMTNVNLKDKQVGEQLIIDIGRYRGHPNCKILVVFVYDKGDHIRNKVGLKNDLEKMSTEEIRVKVHIEPN
jgi:hypothetical protein